MLSNAIASGTTFAVWFGGRWYGRFHGRQFDSRPPRCRATTVGTLLHSFGSVTRQYNFVYRYKSHLA